VRDKTARAFQKIRHVRGLSVDEKLLFAKSLAATPDERWQMHENFLRSHDLFTRSSKKRYGFR
jgi:ABC-type branched-subunit amino acid transport system ATPase component